MMRHHSTRRVRTVCVAAITTVVLLLATGRGTAQEPAPIPAGVAPPPGVYAPGIDVLHYEVEVGLGYGVLWFEGITELEVALTADGPTLPLDFTGLSVAEVSVDGRATEFDYSDGVIRVDLAAYASGDRVHVRVHYEGTPDDGLIIRENVHGDPSAFVDNWPNRTRFWLPSVDHPADKATVRYTIHAPAEWKVIANGAQIGEPTPTPAGSIGPDDTPRRSWIWEVGVPISSYNMVIGAADLEVRTIGLAACGQAPATRREDGCVEVTSWVYPQDVERAEPSFRRAAEMVDYFTDLIGPFPFEKLANVQSATRFGGMENASAIFYSEQGLASGRNMEGTVSHEIAHQWFGDAVTESSWHHLWLSEGFATYFGDQFFEFADGVDAFRELMEENRRSVVNSNVLDRPIYDPEVQDLFALLNSNNYPKGGWVLHMLRGMIGDEVFFDGIRTYYERFLHQSVLTEDFQAVMEEVSQRDLDWFFEQWIYQPGIPILEQSVTWRTDGQLNVTLRQVQPEDWPTFRLPIEIEFEVLGEVRRERVEFTERDQTFTFEGVSREPQRLGIDPDGWILKEMRR